MYANGVAGTGISAHKRANDLSDFAAELDMIEALGVESIELPTYDMDIVVGRQDPAAATRGAEARLRAGARLAIPCTARWRSTSWTRAYRLPRHFEVLEASLEVAAEVGAENYVIHSGLTPTQQGDGIEAAYERQREWFWRRAGDAGPRATA